MRTVAFTEGLPDPYAFDWQSQPRVGIGPRSPACRSFEESHVIVLAHMRELSLQGESCREGSYPSLNGLDHRLAGAHVSSRACLRRAIRSAHVRLCDAQCRWRA